MADADHITVVLADDHAVVRSGLRLLLDHAGFDVLEEAADTELVEAVRRAAAGETYLTPRLGAALATAAIDQDAPPDDLTEREVEVLRLVALGHTNAEI